MIRFIGGFNDTRTNQEDFALTPYLFSVLVIGKIVKVCGIGICWGYYSVYLGLGYNIPKDYPSFIVKKFKKNKIMLVEICNYCNRLLGVFIINGKPCCNFCAEQVKKK